MVFYHAFYTMSYLFNIEAGAYLLNIFMPLEPFFAGIFILISGICCNFSRSNLLRGIKLFLVSITLSLVTYILGPDMFISFGILHMLSICMITYGILEPVLKKAKPVICIVISVLLYIITIPVQEGIFGIKKILEINIPKWAYNSGILFPIGIYNNTFQSADYFPLFPWMFIFFFGVFLGMYFIKNISINLNSDISKTKNTSFYNDVLTKNHSPALSFIGRNSLIIYIVHQPVIYGILYIAGVFIKQIKIY